MVRFRLAPPVLLGLIVLAMAVLIALGSWQVVRQRQMDAFERTREERIFQPPLTWNPRAPLAPRDVDHRRVRVTGRWDNERAFVIANRVRYDTLGQEVATPLLPEGGGAAILVNRGWYPLEAREQVLAELAREQTATVEGLARNIGEQGAKRTPAGLWTRFDVPVLARELPYAVVPWQLIQGAYASEDAPRPTTLPVQRFSPYSPDMPHTEYAITWFGLAAALAATAVVRFRPRREARSAGPNAAPAAR